jgi:YggT family protein
MVGTQIATILSGVIDLYCLVIVVRCLMSFFTGIDRGHPIVRFLYAVTDPVLEPVSRILPPMGGVDLSPLVVLFILKFFQSVGLSPLYGH